MHAKEWEQKHPDQAKAMDGNELKNAGSNSEQAKTFDDQFPQGTAMARKVAFPLREFPIALRVPSLSHDRQF
jgi:hypothetical protein